MDGLFMDRKIKQNVCANTNDRWQTINVIDHKKT
jgi:hypothetical protein